MTTRRRLLAVAGLALGSALGGGVARARQSGPVAGGWPQGAADADFAAARTVLEAWTRAFQAGDYDVQYRLTDPRIRRWINIGRWRKGMTGSNRRTGGLVEYQIAGQSAARGDQLPRTEQGHLHRGDVCYVVFLIHTRYARATAPQPEYAAMSWSQEGWRFGAGTFPNRPLGETAVILTRKDEERYR